VVTTPSNAAKNAVNLRILTHVLPVTFKDPNIDSSSNENNCEVILAMGKVLAIMKIMPEDANAPINELQQQLEQVLQGKVHIEAWEEVPIFGPLSALRLRFIVEDEAGGTTAVEEIIQKVPGVSELEIEAVSLL
jgi:elongation factor 1-beta